MMRGFWPRSSFGSPRPDGPEAEVVDKGVPEEAQRREEAERERGLARAVVELDGSWGGRSGKQLRLNLTLIFTGEIILKR
jgi:hypothetical protein